MVANNPKPGLEKFRDASDGTGDASADALASLDGEQWLGALTVRWKVGPEALMHYQILLLLNIFRRNYHVVVVRRRLLWV